MIPVFAQLLRIPSCDRGFLQIREVLIVDNTEGSDHREATELVLGLLGGTSKSTNRDAKKEEDLVNSAIQWLLPSSRHRTWVLRELQMR